MVISSIRYIISRIMSDDATWGGGDGDWEIFCLLNIYTTTHCHPHTLV